jgi:peptide/nickel transport system ATP-binding protein
MQAEQFATRSSPILLASALTKIYRPEKLFSQQKQTPVVAMQDVSLALERGQTLGLIGASRSGKSTLARCLSCLERPDAGKLSIDGQDVLGLTPKNLRHFCRGVQLVMQGSAASLNPRFSAIDAVAEPLEIAGYSRRERREQALPAMERVGLPRRLATRSCEEYSGGERQRLALARALILEPKILILDETLSGLDAGVQAQIANLLMDLQDALSLTYLFISHDLHIAAHIANHIAVMAGGRIVEQGAKDELMQNPRHATTRLLIAAAGEA